MKIEHYSSPEGVVFSVHAHPGGSYNGINIRNNILQVKVCVPAEKGKANKAILALLAKILNQAKSKLEIINGHTGSHKKVLAHGLNYDTLVELLNSHIVASEK